MPQGHTRRPPASAKVAISLPTALLERLEDLRDRTGESRSAVVRRALELLLHRMDHYEAVREYVESYRLHPETDDDLELGRPTVDELAADEWNTDAGNSDEAG
jgi:Arc/MetJ-type ribon-helix-helix transcriptional regulator